MQTPLVLADVPDAAPVVRMLALATTFDRRAVLAPDALLDRAAELLQRAEIEMERCSLVIEAQLDRERLDGVMARLEKQKILPVLAIEAQSGLARMPALAALDKEEARLAIGEAESTVRRAAALGAPYVVLRLGWVDGARRDWTFARDKFLRAQLSSDRLRGMWHARDVVAPGHIDRARAALDRLCRVADELGVMLLVKNGQRYVELPSASEWTRLAGDLSGAPLEPLFDRPSAHLQAAMGFATMQLTEAAFGEGPVRYEGDACGAVAALPPGHGELGVVARASAHTVFRPWPLLVADEIVLGLRRLR